MGKGRRSELFIKHRRFFTPAMVYQPREDSELLRGAVERFARGDVLDMGTGSGIQALAAAAKEEVRFVLAVDKEEEAIAALARQGHEKIEARVSDLFSNVRVEERFDTIICNPPYLPAHEKDADSAIDGGRKGWEWIARFLRGAKKHLKRGGIILLVFSSLTNKERVLSLFKENGYFFEEVAMTACFFEQLYAYKGGVRGGMEASLPSPGEEGGGGG